MALALANGSGVSPLFGQEITCGFTQISNSSGVLVGGAPVAMSADGRRALFLGRGNPTGENPSGRMELFLYETATGRAVQLTRSAVDDAFGSQVSASDDLRRVVFRSEQDLVGLNPSRTSQIYLFDTVDRSFRQITLGTREFALRSFPPVISGDGGVVALLSREDPVQKNADGSREIFLYNVATGSLRQVTEGSQLSFPSIPALSRDGRRIAAKITRSLSGLNELVLIDTLTGDNTILASAERMGDPVVSGDGGRVFFVSQIDPFGANPTGGQQIFLAATQGSPARPSVRQLTQFQGGPALEGLAASGDGARIAFRTQADLLGFKGNGAANYFLLNVDVGDLYQLTFQSDGAGATGPLLLSYAGNRFLVALNSDPLNLNQDRNQEAFLVDCSPSETYYFPQVGNGVSGDIRIQTNFVFSNIGEDTSVQLEFFDASGRPAAFPLRSHGARSFFNFALAKGTPLILETDGAGPLSVGYARVRGGPGLTGAAVFTGGKASTDMVFYEAAVPLIRPLTDFTVVVNTLGDFQTGLALVNAEPVGDGQDGTAHLRLRLYNRTFQLLAVRELTLAPGEHSARFVDAAMFDGVADIDEMVGTLTVESDRPLAVITLRLRDNPNRDFPFEIPTLTTLPVSPGRPDQ